LVVMAADCLPVLVADRAGRIVGAAHGGWRGLAAGVVGALVDALRARLPDADLMAWLGPRIGPSAFEVGAEVRDAFITRSPLYHDAFVASPIAGRWLGDLGAIARVDLAAHDVARITDSALCTVADPIRFWSHRRDRPGGRMAALIRRVGDGVAV
jgi:YfiH family protein